MFLCIFASVQVFAAKLNVILAMYFLPSHPHMLNWIRVQEGKYKYKIFLENETVRKELLGSFVGAFN